MDKQVYFKMLFGHKKYLTLICVIASLFVLSLVDEFDIPSRLMQWLCVYTHYKLPFIFGCICIISVMIAMVNYSKKVITTSSSYIIDLCIFICGIATLIYTVILILCDEKRWKIYVLSVMVFLCINIIVYRAYRYYILQNGSVPVSSNLYDLKDIYEKGVEDANPDIPILISDEAVGYDLLEREFIISTLLNEIHASRSERSFVIGLEGEWGSGKTTIVNIVEERLNKHNTNNGGSASRYVVLSDFNLWLYNDNETFLLEMFDAILKASGAEYSFIQRKKAEMVLSELLAHNNMTSVMNTLLFTPGKLGNHLQKIKKDIEQYLECSDKFLVLFIDDIDRALPENVGFLFKVLSLILDLKRTIYILSYDPQQLQHIFSIRVQIDPKYIEKIIHSRIKVDVPSAKMADVCSKCLHNILSVYEKENKNKYDKLISCIISNVKNIREFKRIVNSVLYAPMAYGSHLYRPDLLSIEYIKYANFKLYHEIYSNKMYFISYDTRHNMDITGRTINNEEFEKEKAAFWDKFDESIDYAAYRDIVSELFPQDASKYDSHDRDSNLSDKNVAKQARICSAIYFELYFNYTSNTYIEIKEDVLGFITIANGAESLDALISVFLTSINKYEPFIWFKLFILFIDDILKNKSTLVASVLFQVIYHNGNVNLLYTTECISKLLKNSDLCAVRSFCQSIKSSYSKLSIIKIIRNKTVPNIDVDDKIRAVIYNCYSEMCNKIITDKINLYSDDNYYYYNIDGLFMFCQEKPDIIRDYISSIMSSENIYRILGDTISYTVGSDYSYFIAKDRCKLVFGDINDKDKVISKLLNEHPATTESEKFVLKIYKDKDTKNPYADGGMGNIVIPQPFIFNL